MSTSKYKRGEIIGRGNFGVVYKGVNLETRQVVAIKVLDLDTAEDDVLDVQREISLLSRLSQSSEASNITRYFGSYLNGTKLWIIMDLCAGGSIRTLLKPGKIEERYISIIVREMLHGLSYIHKAGVIHRDIKAANVLITNEGQVRLCDFGVAAEVSSSKLKRSTIVGTPYWMAPEVITEGAFYNARADIWSLGITVYEVAVGNPPYSDQEAMRAIMLIPRQKPARLEGSQFSSALKEFVALCLDEHPNERPSADELLKTKFVKLSKNTPTTVLRDLVTRYVSWKSKNGNNVRDSMAILNKMKPIHLEDDEDYENIAKQQQQSFDMEETGSSVDVSETVWDFDIDDIEETPIEPENDLTESVQNELAGLGLSTPGLDTVVNPGISSNNPTVREYRSSPPEKPPQSLLELFEQEDGEDDPPSIKNPGILGPQRMNSVSGRISPAVNTAPMLPSSTPVIEIEIPSFEDMNATARAPQPTSAIPPQLTHQQSVPIIPTQGGLNNVSMGQLSSNSSASLANRHIARAGPNTASASTSNLPSLGSNNSSAIMPPPATSRNRSPSPKRLESISAGASTPNMRQLNWQTSSGNAASPRVRSPSTSESKEPGAEVMPPNGPSRNGKLGHIPQLASSSASSGAVPVTAPTTKTTITRKNSLLSSRPVLSASTTSAIESPLASPATAGPIAQQSSSTTTGPSTRPIRPTNLRIAMPSPAYSQFEATSGPSLASNQSSGFQSGDSSHEGYEDGDTTLEDIPIPHQRDAFPSMPQLNPTILLDTTPKGRVVRELGDLLEMYSKGLQVLEDGLSKQSV